MLDREQFDALEAPLSCEVKDQSPLRGRLVVRAAEITGVFDLEPTYGTYHGYLRGIQDRKECAEVITLDGRQRQGRLISGAIHR